MIASIMFGSLTLLSLCLGMPTSGVCVCLLTLTMVAEGPGEEDPTKTMLLHYNLRVVKEIGHKNTI